MPITLVPEDQVERFCTDNAVLTIDTLKNVPLRTICESLPQDPIGQWKKVHGTDWQTWHVCT
jgi:hypothetical protein